MAPDPIRVLVVDDHAVVREGLRTFLELQDGIEVVGEAADGEQAVAQAAQLEPDVILMDLVMPRLDGIGAMRELRARSSPSRVIVLTSFLDDERLMPALQAGAAGYLLKDVEPAELARAVRSACADEALIDPTVAARLLHTLSSRESAGGARRRHRAPDPSRARGPGADRARALQQADRAGARRRREDGQDPRRAPAGQARRRRPHPGGAVRGPARAGRRVAVASDGRARPRGDAIHA